MWGESGEIGCVVAPNSGALNGPTTGDAFGQTGNPSWNPGPVLDGGGARAPDYYAVNVNVAIPNPWTPRLSD